MRKAKHGNDYFYPEERKDGWFYYCPECGHPVIPVCGNVNIHHWRHEKHSSCRWGVGMTQWHYSMQDMFDKEFVEVKHGALRSDVLLRHGTAIEFQNCPITAETIKFRNASVDRIVWVFNIEDQFERGQISIDETNHYEYSRPKKYFEHCGENLYWYCNDLIFKVLNISDDRYYDDNSGYNVPAIKGLLKPYTCMGFKMMIEEYDRQFRIDTPPTQGTLFNLTPDYDD